MRPSNLQRLFRPDASETVEEDLLDKLPQGLPADLDWNSYFEEFKRHHGEPVLHKDRLLFPDGWSYSSRSKAGPEYPPPPWPELGAQLVTYWSLRLKLVQTEARLLEDAIRSLRELQHTHSLPLRCASRQPDETGRMVSEALEVNVEELEKGRLAWLQNDIKDCQEELRRLAHLQRLTTNRTL